MRVNAGALIGGGDMVCRRFISPEYVTAVVKLGGSAETRGAGTEGERDAERAEPEAEAGLRVHARSDADGHVLQRSLAGVRVVRCRETLSRL